MAKTYVHVKPSDGVGGRKTSAGWRVQTGEEGKGKIVSTHSLKRRAIKRAKQYARNHKRRPSQVVIRKTNGQIQNEVSYSE